MEKRTLLLLTGTLIAISLLALGGRQAYGKWQASRPTQENFDPIVKALWEKNNPAKGAHLLGDSANALCIPVPRYPAPDSQSKAQQPMAWYFDFFPTTPSSQARDKQLQQLDALSKAGLLRKTKAISTLNGEPQVATRYALSETGWSASARPRGEWCFPYGRPRYLGITRFAPMVANERAGLEVYEVRVKIGLRSEADLPPWARDPQLRAAFPEIQKGFDGQEFPVLLARGSGGWIDLQTMLEEEAVKKNPELAGQLNPKPARMSEKTRHKLEEQKAQPPPTVDEVKNLLRAAHGVGKQDPWPIPCLDLPGSEKLPVDKELFTYRPPHYAVAIFTNKTRKPHDRVGKKTLPYLAMLEQLGILVKHIERGVPGQGKDAGSQYDAAVYELAPAYEPLIHSRYPYCFALGEPSVEFVDVELIEKDYEGFPISSFRYKLKVLYRNPPQWMKNPALVDNWPELQGVLDRGMACDGEFQFDRKTRTQHSGAGSCWWAFDSYYENY